MSLLTEKLTCEQVCFKNATTLQVAGQNRAVKTCKLMHEQLTSIPK